MVDFKRTFVWLMLSVQALARRFPPQDPQVSAIYTISAGLQVVQSVSMVQIASLLNIPAGRLKIPAKSLGIVSGDGKTPLRQALDNLCGVRSRAVQLAGVWREMPGDLEVAALLEVMRQVQRDSCRWLAVEAGTDSSVCSTEERLEHVCLQWEALTTAEEAENGLEEFVDKVGLTIEPSQRRQITSITISEIIMQYFTP